MKVEWTSDAERDRHEIWDFIAESDIAAADRLIDRFEETIDRISNLPKMGRPGAFIGTREFIANPSYRIVYYVGESTLYILGLIHTSRQWPPIVE
jgi:toxin ParE1/3/4